MNMFDDEYQEFSSEKRGSANEMQMSDQIPANSVSPFNNMRIQSKATTTETKGKRQRRKQSKMSMQCNTINPLID